MYSSVTDVQKRAQLLGSVDSAKILSGIAWADAVIESRLAGRYGIPFTAPTPAIIREISADLAAYYILFEEHTAGGEGVPVEAALELKGRAYLLLTDLQNGTSVLPGLVGPSGVSPISSTLGNSNSPNVLRGFDLVNVPCSNNPPFASQRYPGYRGGL